MTDDLARQAPEGLVGVHLNLFRSALGSTAGLPAESGEEKAALEAVATFRTSGFGYFLEQSTRPQTIGYALLDSPVALAGWMLDHDTDSYYKIAGAFVDGKPTGNLTRDHILDNVTLYWLTATGASAARSYWEGGRAAALAAGKTPPRGLDSGRLHDLPRRDLPRAAQLGRARLPERRLLQRGRQRRSLRRLGGAAALQRRAPGGVQLAPLKGGPMSSVSTQLPTVEGRGSVTGAPNLPDGFGDTFTSRLVDLGELQLHAVIGGEGPPLLLVHGWPQSWYAWRMLMPALARDFEVIAVDQRGIGLSDKPATATTPRRSRTTSSR